MEKKMGFFEKLKKSLSKAGNGMLGAIFAGGERVNNEFYEELEERSDKFIKKLEKIIEGKGIQLNRCGSMFTLFFNDEPVRNFQDTKRSNQERFAKYFINMLSRGIYVSPSQFEGNFISACHTQDILDYVLKSIEESIE